MKKDVTKKIEDLRIMHWNSDLAVFQTARQFADSNNLEVEAKIVYLLLTYIILKFCTNR